MIHKDHTSFGARRVYYNNFAGHLLNAYNPNMLHPGLPHHWSDGDWRACLDMVAGFGFNVFEFWLEPRLFCREGLEGAAGIEFTRQMNVLCDHAHSLGIQVEFICSLATVGPDWNTLCPKMPEEWRQICYLWDEWTRRLSGIDIVGIFPGDPGACSRNGCTALTYIDKSCEIAALVKRNLPKTEIEFHTWGPPFFGWGLIEGPPTWRGEFCAPYQHTAWKFDARRTEDAMCHLLRRLPDFPSETSVAINLGFNPDGNPEGEQDARAWARAIAENRPIHTWDFSLTEGENNVVPHYRCRRLFEQRKRERAAAPFSGGICYTMTPLLNQLSLWMAAQSFLTPDADPEALAGDFYARMFGPEGRKIVPYLPFFEVVKDWGNHVDINPADGDYHRTMTELRDLLETLTPRMDSAFAFHPDPAAYHRSLLFFATLYAGLSARMPDFNALATRFWNHVYSIYDHLDAHVDPRPKMAVDMMVNAFRNARKVKSPPIPGKWN